MLRTMLLAISLTLGVTVLLPSSVLAGANKYTPIYNSVTATYTSLQHIAGAHNRFSKARHASCSRDQAHKWWRYRYRKDVKAVSVAERKLAAINAKRSRTYQDFAQGFKDLVRWMNHSLKPRLSTCQAMPTNSLVFENDLQNIKADLGINTY